MRNKFSKKINTAIELTSLLDVIFIVLMVVICNQQINMTAKTEEAQAVMQEALEMEAEAEDAAAEAMTEKLLFEEHRDTYETINEQMDILTVYVTYTPSNPENRVIMVMANEEELPHIRLTPENSGKALGDLSKLLDDRAAKAEKDGKPMIISVNTDRILYRDEKSVRKIFDDLADDHGNIFYKTAK